MFNWRNWWENMLSSFGLGVDSGDKLDQASQKMQHEVDLYRQLAGKSVALYRTRQNELAAVVKKHQEMEQAAVILQREGKTDAVNYTAVQLADSAAHIKALTEEINSLFKGAEQDVGQFKLKKDEAKELLRSHGQLKAVDAMNQQLEDLQAQMKSLTGSVSATEGYKSLADGIKSKQNEFRAIAELESGDVTQRLAVNAALKSVEASNILAEIQAKAALPDSTAPIKLTPLDSAMEALDRDPISGLRSLPQSTPTTPTDAITSGTPPEVAQVIDEGGSN